MLSSSFCSYFELGSCLLSYLQSSFIPSVPFLSVINFDGRWTLIGITSAGFGCAVEKQPGIYHKVSKTARWIAHMIRKP